MWPSRLFWKLFLMPVGISLVLALISVVLVARWQEQLLWDQARAQLYASAVMLRSRVEGDFPRQSTDELQQLVERLSTQTGRRTRITLIGDQGLVLADSHENPQSMNNHGQRLEVRQARLHGVGVVRRHSDTLDVPMLYLALPVGPAEDPDGFVRVAFDLGGLEADVGAMQRSLWLLVGIVVALGAALSYIMVRRVTLPLEELTSGAHALAEGHEAPLRMPVRSRDELGTLATAFNDMQTRLRARLDELRENSERLATVLGNMVEGVIAVSPDDRILLANEASRKLLNFATAQPAGRPLLEVTRSRPVHEAVHEALSTKEPCQREFEAPGTPRRVLSLRATRLPGQPCPGAVIVLHDITELRRLENLRRELVANVSHELKTPLASIKVYAETLRLGAVNDPLHNVDFVSRIEDQAERLHQLILDLLQIARVEAGQEVFEITDVPLHQLIEGCLQQFQDAASARQIRLEIRPPGETLAVRADEEGVRTILNNLVDNAIKYTPDGGLVSIGWHGRDGNVVLEVADSGIGIAPQHQARIFERFYRVDRARSRELGGTGLGLSIVKHLAQAFGGSVGLESQPGQGSTFRVQLPRA